MNNKTIGKLFFQSFLLLVLLFGLARLVVIKNGFTAKLELVVLVSLLLLSVIGLITYNKSGSKLLFFVFMLHVLNVLYLWYFYHSLYLVLLLVSLVGFWLSMPGRAGKCSKEKACCEDSCESVCGPASSAPPQKVGEAKEVKAVEPSAAKTKETDIKEKPAAVKTTFTPGKYVASKRSNVYHEPKCDWAKKIQKDRRAWFASREEALDKGYKKHSCVR